MAATIKGWLYGPLQQDAEGHRNYKLTVKVRAAYTDGPAVVLAAVNAVYAYGSVWAPPSSADADAYAYRRLETAVKPVLADTSNIDWEAELNYSTKADRGNCRDAQFDNPLLEPQKVSGGFTRSTEEAVYDRFGNYIVNSAHEQMRGPQVEFDANRPTVKVEQNVASLQLPLIAALQNCVNDATMWGLPARTIKLSNADWEVKYYGTCLYYYTRKFEFDINYDTFDRYLLDEGSKVLHGRWHPTEDRWQLIQINGRDPDPANPQHFDRYKDRNGENARVILNGHGIPITTDPSGTATSTQIANRLYPGSIRVEKYHSANLLLLGIPTSI